MYFYGLLYSLYIYIYIAVTPKRYTGIEIFHSPYKTKITDTIEGEKKKIRDTLQRCFCKSY
jgi:hypothetical protein